MSPLRTRLLNYCINPSFMCSASSSLPYLLLKHHNKNQNPSYNIGLFTTRGVAGTSIPARPQPAL